MEGKEQSYQFGPFRLDTARRLLLQDGKVVPITPKAFDILHALIQRKGEVVTKDELMQAVWPDTVVEENNLTRSISALRKALGESPGEHRYIVTIPGRGYQLVAEVSESAGEELDGAGSDSGRDSLQAFATSPTPLERTPRGIGLALVFGLLLLAGASFGLYKFFSRKPIVATPEKTPGGIEITRLMTAAGRPVDAAISPDGKYVGYVIERGAEQSLWVRQVASATNVEIVPPANVEYWGLTFSRDGNFIYYVTWGRNKPSGVLFEVPVMGGASRMLLEDPDTGVTPSPDGKRFAFVVMYSTRGESQLRVATFDGAEKRTLLTRTQPEYLVAFPGGLAWSPDAERIAFAVARSDAKGRRMNVLEIRVADGAERVIGRQKWHDVGRMAWLPDGSGLILTARDQPSAPRQVWHLTYPAGEARRITNDLNNYTGLSLTTDSRTLATVQNVQPSNIWVVPDGDAGRARQVTSGVGKIWEDSIAWTPDGSVIYSSNAGGNQDIWITRSDGTNQRQLTVDPATDIHPATSPDGRYVVFASDRAGYLNVWRMDPEGGSLKKLTEGAGDAFPVCSPDGKWVVYQRGFGAVKSTLWKVPIEGGDSVQLTETYSTMPAISPDGAALSCFHRERDSPWKIAIVPLKGGKPTKVLDFPATAGSKIVRWALDGRSLAYIDNRGGLSNVWSLPIGGGPPTQVTDFKSEQLFSFQWSWDGRHLACLRGVWNSDVVLIRNFGNQQAR